MAIIFIYLFPTLYNLFKTSMFIKNEISSSISTFLTGFSPIISCNCRCLLLKYCCLCSLNSGHSAITCFIVRGTMQYSQYGCGICSIRCPCVTRVCPMRSLVRVTFTFRILLLDDGQLSMSGFMLRNLLLPTVSHICCPFCRIAFLMTGC